MTFARRDERDYEHASEREVLRRGQRDGSPTPPRVQMQACRNDDRGCEQCGQWRPLLDDARLDLIGRAPSGRERDRRHEADDRQRERT